jgi:hypothetical protein
MILDTGIPLANEWRFRRSGSTMQKKHHRLGCIPSPEDDELLGAVHVQLHNFSNAVIHLIVAAKLSCTCRPQKNRSRGYYHD